MLKAFWLYPTTGRLTGYAAPAMQKQRDEITRLIGEIDAHIRAAKEQVGAGAEGE